jgi:hypothetical protein
MRYRQLAQQAGGMPSAPTMATAAGPGMIGTPQPAQPMVSIAGQPFNQAGQPMQQNGFQTMMPGTPQYQQMQDAIAQAQANGGFNGMLQAAYRPPTNPQANAAQYAALARQFGPAAAAAAFPGMAPNPQMAAPVGPPNAGAQPMPMAGVSGPVNALARYYTR